MSPPDPACGVFNENGYLSAPLMRERLKQRRHDMTSWAERTLPPVSQPGFDQAKTETAGEPGAAPSPSPADAAGPALT